MSDRPNRDQVPGQTRKGQAPGPGPETEAKRTGFGAPDRPTAAELVEAVFEFLAEEVLPNAPDHRAKFRTLVAMNALGIARRELDSKEQIPSQDELRQLARRIRAGEPADLGELKAHVAAKLRISNPSYLEKYE